MDLRTGFSLTPAVLLLTAFSLAQSPAQLRTPPPAPSDTPVGHWVSEHPSKGGIGSWFDFRPDGTLTMNYGAITSNPYTHSATDITIPADNEGAAPIRIPFQILGDTLHLKAPGSPQTIYTRSGPAPSPADPLLGRWRPLPPADPATDPDTAAQHKIMEKGLIIFSPDGTQSVRISFGSREGTWDSSSHTFHLQGDIHPYTLQRTGPKLKLGQPPSGLHTDTYLPDPLL